MFRVKAKTKPGQCCAMRCKLPTQGSELCERHLAEWHEAGEPPLTAAESNPAPKAVKSTALLAPDAVRAEIEPTRSNLETLLQKVSTLPLDSQAALDWMGEARKFARAAREWLDGRRKAIKAPILEAGRVCDATFKPGIDQADAVIDCCDKRLLAFEADRKAAQDTALAAVGRGASDRATLIAAHGGAAVLPATVDKRGALRVRVTSHEAIPRPFLQLNESLALEYAKERGGASCKVPGLEFFMEDTLAAARAS
jgi:hypothetical protein